MFRIGIGTDTHRLVEGRTLILGGVTVASDLGAEGHSDADALSHAIADALLGAIGAGDIGQHFPNTDESIRGISSMEILKRVGNLLNERNARVINVDATVIAEAPKLAPHVPAMRQEIAAAIGVSLARSVGACGFRGFAAPCRTGSRKWKTKMEIFKPGREFT